MSKAEERALEKYPQKVEWVGNQWDGAPFDVNSKSRVAYEQGYHQAEKDLELSWEDIKLVHNITYEESRNVALNKGGEISEQEFYQEVLKRFKESKQQ